MQLPFLGNEHPVIKSENLYVYMKHVIYKYIDIHIDIYIYIYVCVCNLFFNDNTYSHLNVDFFVFSTTAHLIDRHAVLWDPTVGSG